MDDKAVAVSKNVNGAPCMKRECPTDHRCMKAVMPETVIDKALELHSRLL